MGGRRELMRKVKSYVEEMGGLEVVETTTRKHPAVRWIMPTGRRYLFTVPANPCPHRGIQNIRRGITALIRKEAAEHL